MRWSQEFSANNIQKHRSSPRRATAISLPDLSGVFTILLIGIVLGCLMLMVEVIAHRVRRLSQQLLFFPLQSVPSRGTNSNIRKA